MKLPRPTTPLLPLALAFFFVPASARAMDVGVDMNQPTSGGVPNVAAISALASVRAPWVRIGFDRGIWTGPTDTTPRGPQNLTWAQAYDKIVDGFLASGIQVYGLINAGITSAPGTNDSDAWQLAYVADATAAIDHLKNRVRVFEIYNEPNNWVAPNTPALASSPFSHLLARTYQSVKVAHASDRCWQVQLLSGPVYSGDPTNGGTGADFLTSTYQAGEAQWGWSDIKTQTGSYPIDGAGYHIYVQQGSTDDATIQSAVATNANAFAAALSAAEGGSTAKKLWVSEIGWRTGAVPAAGQASDMLSGFSALAAIGAVELGVWFSLQDFGTNDQWGLYTGSPYGASTVKASAAEYTTIAGTDRPALLAHLDPSTPLGGTIAEGGTTHVHLRVVNDGTRAWSASAINPIRLGAASGCPDASTTNELPWSGFVAGGYANSVTDARVFLASDVAPGGSATFDFDVAAPSAPATTQTTLAVRMVSEGEAWFGSTIYGTYTIAADDDGGLDGDALAPPDDASTAPAPPAPEPGSAVADAATGNAATTAASSARGCSAAPTQPSGRWSPFAAIFMLALRRRRVR